MLYPNNLDLTLIKKHLNLDADFNLDDEILFLYMEAALTSIQTHIDEDLESVLDENGNLPSPLVQAALLLIATFYNTREATTYTTVSEAPLAYRYLLSLYQNYGEKM